MDELAALRAQILARKQKQNARRAKAGKPPMWPELIKPKKSKAATPPPAESGLEEDTAMTFEEWKEFGWSVKKGSKAHDFDRSGKPLFTRSQVRKTNPQWEKYRTLKKK